MVSGKKKAIHEGQPFVIISFFFAKELGGKVYKSIAAIPQVKKFERQQYNLT